LAGVPTAGGYLADIVRKSLPELPPVIRLKRIELQGNWLMYVEPADREHVDRDRPVLLLDDVTHRAAMKRLAVTAIRRAGGSVNRILVLIDRGHGGHERLAQLGIQHHSILTLADILAVLQEQNRITPEVFECMSAWLAANRIGPWTDV
jgi:orotate phosphoribosyltransferase